MKFLIITIMLLILIGCAAPSEYYWPPVYTSEHSSGMNYVDEINREMIRKTMRYNE